MVGDKMKRKELDETTCKKLRQQIAAIRQEMQYAANDLEYESYLHMVRSLEELLKKR